MMRNKINAKEEANAKETVTRMKNHSTIQSS